MSFQPPDLSTPTYRWCHNLMMQRVIIDGKHWAECQICKRRRKL